MVKINKPNVFVLSKRKEKPALKGRHYPGYFRLPSTDEIYDEKEDKVRTIRYAIGEPSLFKDEQPEKVTLGDIIFSNGTLIVDRMNPSLLKFLALSNHNGDNPNRNTSKSVFFTKLNPEVNAKKSVDSIINESKAVSLALSMDFNKLKGYAKVMGIDINRSADEIRHDMIIFAKQKPNMFMDGIDNPVIARQTIIDQAREMGVLLFEGRSVKWATGGKNSTILLVPVGISVAEYFAEWTISDKDGNAVFDELEKRVTKKIKAE